MTRHLFLSLLLILQANLAGADAAELAAGPMVGVTAMRSARIWLQTAKPGTVQVVYWPESAPKIKLRVVAVQLERGGHAHAKTLNRQPT